MKFTLSNEPHSGLAVEGVVLGVEGRLTFNTNLIAKNGKVAATTQAVSIHLQSGNPDLAKTDGLTDAQIKIATAESVARTKIAEALIELKAVYESLEPKTT